jgi:hypothetical protein
MLCWQEGRLQAMDKDEIRKRTKIAVSRWCVTTEPGDISLDDTLDSLRSGDRGILRQRVNEQFAGEQGFPISAPDWNAEDLDTVGDVRDFVSKRMGVK